MALGCAPVVAPTASPATPEAALQRRLDLAARFWRLPELIRDSLVAPRWLRTGDRLVFWSELEPGGSTWVQVDARTGTRRPLLSGAELRAQLRLLEGDAGEPALRPRDFAIAADQRSIAFAVGERVFGVGLEDGRVRVLAADDPAARSLSPEHFAAAAGGAVAEQRGAGFLVRDADGRVVVEHEGNEQLAWRIPEAPWSPDARWLAVWQDDLRAVHKIPIVDHEGALERVTWVPYAKTGTPLPRMILHFVEPATGRVVPVSHVVGVAGETHDWFVGWLVDSGEALTLHVSRDGKRLELVAVDPTNGARRQVLREQRPRSFVAGLDFAVGGWARQVTLLPDGKGLLWLSERDGWRHVYLYDLDGGLVRQVTRGEFPVHEVVAVVGDAVHVLASADPGAPYEHLLYRGSLHGGPLQRLSSGEGMHRVSFAPSGRYYVDTWSSRTQPRLRELVATDASTTVRLTTADVSALVNLGHTAPEGFTVVAADGVTPLHGVLYKPRDFDPRRRHAVLVHIYAGPFATAVPWSFVGNAMSLASAAMAQMGLVVVMLDPRGGPGRSKAFQDANYGRVGQTEIPDHLTALEQLARTRKWMDLSRVGIYGHSWGGYFALRGMLTAPETFTAGYAGAPGALDEEAIINEPYLGLPDANPAGYQAGDNLALAGRLRAALKIMHGTHDINAPLTTTLRMAKALIRAGKRFELLIMPGQPHSPEPPADRYYFDDVNLFFARTLGGPR